MSNPTVLTYQLAAAVANGICQSQTPGAAGALTMNGSLVTAGVAVLDVARRVVVNSTGADAAVVFTITGTNRNGGVQTDTVTGLNNSNGYTLRDFKTVTSVTSSAGTVGAITVGTNTVGSSEWQVMNFLAVFWALSVAATSPAGTTYTIEHTYDDPNAIPASTSISQFSAEPGSTQPPKAWPNALANGVSGNAEMSYVAPIFAWRLTITAGTGQAKAWSIQAIT